MWFKRRVTKGAYRAEVGRLQLANRTLQADNRTLQDKLCEARTFLGVAHGCGVHDDSKALQKYFDAASEDGGRISYPSGVYNVSVPLVYQGRPEELREANFIVVVPMSPDPESGATLVEIVTALADVYDDRGSAIWLTSDQAWNRGQTATFYATAMWEIRNGRSAEVLAAVERLRNGAM